MNEAHAALIAAIIAGITALIGTVVTLVVGRMQSRAAIAAADRAAEAADRATQAAKDTAAVAARVAHDQELRPGRRAAYKSVVIAARDHSDLAYRVGETVRGCCLGMVEEPVRMDQETMDPLVQAIDELAVEGGPQEVLALAMEVREKGKAVRTKASHLPIQAAQARSASRRADGTLIIPIDESDIEGDGIMIPDPYELIEELRNSRREFMQVVNRFATAARDYFDTPPVAE
ncbi:hypothetical protein [Streptomyces acidicola]|uniref:hypothetical protein n=1 Tax=Streptomyces acidicola TaxID=2596892 RepID=UPI003430AEE5